MTKMLVSIRDLTLRLPSGDRTLTVLDGVSLDVTAGETVAVAGPSGSGKSTLLGLIGGLDAPTSGTIVVAGMEVTRLGEAALARFRRETLGYVFQSYHLIPTLTAAENVAVPFDLAGVAGATARTADLLASVGLIDRAHHYPAQLSGGEQQRVALARAVALDPPLLLADEPTGNLDSATGVALGVAALVAVGSFAATLDHTLAREAKALTGGDLEIRAARPLDGEVAAALADLEARGATVVRVRELAAMARGADGRALLVELKAPGAGYPLYGRFEAAPPEPLAALLAGGGAVVQREALERLGILVGDRLTLGAATFTVRGTVEREPDRSASLLTLRPRVFVAADALARTGLVQRGSRVRYRALVRLPAPLAARETREALARRIADPGVRVASYDEAQPGLRRFLSQLASYLGLVGLASLFVGGIGVASSVATFVRRQSPTIAILKALGADSRTVLATFLWQTLTVGVVASLAGAVLGATLQPVLIRLLAGFVPFTLEPRFEPLSLARGV